MHTLPPDPLGRRGLLRMLSAAAILPLAAPLARALPAPRRRLLVLVELQGGNDGLNTVVPLTQPAYRALRPTLGLAPDSLLKIGRDTGLHPALAPLLPAWDAGEAAIVQGVGYPRPNRSHFRSIEIWDGAATDGRFEEGWVAGILRRQPPPAAATAEGVVLGRPYLGPLSGPGRRIAVMDGAEAFAERGGGLQRASGRTGNPALAHVLETRAEAAETAARVARDLRRVRDDAALAARLDRFPTDPFGRQCREVALLLAAGSDIPVIKTSIGSFDTHVRQAPTHARLLAQLAGGLGELRRFAREDGSWSDVLVLTYSEFGRRAAENRAAGTDHGAAAPHFVLGGRVRGGLIGDSPDLERLEDGNVGATIDFRRLLATVAKRWWQAPAGDAIGDQWAPFDIL